MKVIPTNASAMSIRMSRSFVGTVDVMGIPRVWHNEIATLVICRVWVLADLVSKTSHISTLVGTHAPTRFSIMTARSIFYSANCLWKVYFNIVEQTLGNYIPFLRFGGGGHIDTSCFFTSTATISLQCGHGII